MVGWKLKQNVSNEMMLFRPLAGYAHDLCVAFSKFYLIENSAMASKATNYISGKALLSLFKNTSSLFSES